MRAAVILSYPKGDNSVPFYLQPMLGGSDDLRGFVPYRFRDYHRGVRGSSTAGRRSACWTWRSSSMPAKSSRSSAISSPTNMHYSGGLGFRFRLRSAIVTRVDLAASSEGFRIICTFSDIFSPKF